MGLTHERCTGADGREAAATIEVDGREHEGRAGGRCDGIRTVACVLGTISAILCPDAGWILSFSLFAHEKYSVGESETLAKKAYLFGIGGPQELAPSSYCLMLLESQYSDWPAGHTRHQAIVKRLPLVLFVKLRSFV